MSLHNWLDAPPKTIRSRFQVGMACFFAWVVGMVLGGILGG